jgi:hypothetical protein
LEKVKANFKLNQQENEWCINAKRRKESEMMPREDVLKRSIPQGP